MAKDLHLGLLGILSNSFNMEKCSVGDLSHLTLHYSMFKLPNVPWGIGENKQVVLPQVDLSMPSVCLWWCIWNYQVVTQGFVLAP